MFKENKLRYANNYTKVSDELVAKYGIKVAYVYAKLRYRMRLSHKNNNDHFKDHHGHFIIYKVNDLAKDCHLGRNSVINSLKKLEQVGLISKIRTMFSNKLYLPKFNNESTDFNNISYESLKSKPSNNNKDFKINNNNYVYCSNRSSVKKADQHCKKTFPKLSQMVKRFGKPLVHYSFKIYHRTLDKGEHIHNGLHFIYGILRRWQRKGIKTVNDAMLSEHDCHAQLNDDGPTIPIFKI